jgi:hypothetical protein
MNQLISSRCPGQCDRTVISTRGKPREGAARGKHQSESRLEPVARYSRLRGDLDLHAIEV